MGQQKGQNSSRHIPLQCTKVFGRLTIILTGNAITPFKCIYFNMELVAITASSRMAFLRKIYDHKQAVTAVRCRIRYAKAGVHALLLDLQRAHAKAGIFKNRSGPVRQTWLNDCGHHHHHHHPNISNRHWCELLVRHCASCHTSSINRQREMFRCVFLSAASKS